MDVLSEIELAWRVLDAIGADQGERPRLVAITGTNGKTTVTNLVVAMLAASGKDAVAAGNVGYPLIEAVSHISPGSQGVLVAEVSSFQLEYTKNFRPDVSCWLNFAPDHLDWHPSLDQYARAKAKIWASQGDGCVAVVNADDPVVRRPEATSRPGLKSSRSAPGRSRPDGEAATNTGLPEPDVAREPRGDRRPTRFFPACGGPAQGACPTTLPNTAAALAVAMAAGCKHGGLPASGRQHAPARPPGATGRPVRGVAWYDDSKATTPAAVRAGVSGFSSVVLIAGGRNKGLDLSDLAGTVPPVRAVVAIGEASNEVTSAFFGQVPVRQAGSMAEAVDAAMSLAVAG